MFLFKLKNNRGYSTINWAILLTTTVFVLCLMLDLVNLFVVKNIMVNRLSYLANIGTIQGGFIGGAPAGWGYLFPGKHYVTNSEADSYFRSSLSPYSVSNIELSGLGMVPVHEEGNLVGKVTFTPSFTKNIGMPSFDLSHTAKFCGFYFYESTRV